MIRAQFNIAAPATNYTQDFNSLTSGTWSDNTTLTGWYAKTTATASITAYAANTGATTAAGLFAFGVSGTNPLSDRAIGFVTTNAFTGAASTGKNFAGWRLKNTTGGDLSSITVTWAGEQWRKESNVTPQDLILAYQTGATVTNLTAGTWITTTSKFTSPIATVATATALDGNANANRAAGITITITVNIPAGEEIMLRWEDLNDAGTDHSLAFDDVVVSATAASPIPSVNSTLTDAGVYGTAYTYSITATNFPTSYGASGLPAGLSVNSVTGVISGTPTVTGTFNIAITATNGSGSDTKTLVLTIAPKPLTITGLSGANKVYDGTTVATVFGTAVLSGIYGADVVTLSGSSTGAFATSNVGNNIAITVSGYTLSGASASNYTLTQPTGLTANITPKSLTISGATANNKPYDGSTTATISGTLVGVIGADAVALPSTGTFASPNVGVGIAVTFPTTLSGAAAGNYTLTIPSGVVADITQAGQTITFGALPDQVLSAGTFTLTATSSSGLPITYTSSDPAVATVSGNVVTIIGLGTTVITASQPGNANYTAATNVIQNQAIIDGPCFQETFDGLSGDNTTSGGSSTSWTGNTNFPLCNTVYQAGNAIRLGSGSASGSITSRSLTGISGNVSVIFDVKGWSSVEGDIKVTLGGVAQTVTYAATYTPGAFDTKTLAFSGVADGSTLKIETTAKRAFIDNIKVLCTTGPEIDVKGNSTSIPSGSAIPTLSNHTDFGSAAVTVGMVSRTFTIENTGAAELTLTGTPLMSISGTNAADFSVFTLPASPVAASSATTFQIHFVPSAIGVRTAMISIVNNDSDENPYTFAVQGTGTNSNLSDIVEDATFAYSSNIDYTLYQTPSLVSTAGNIGVMNFIIRDGGAVGSDADNYGTSLTGIAFNVNSITPIRSAAIFDGSTMLNNTPVISGSNITFSGLSGAGYTAADNATKTLTLRVSFSTTITDNQQLQFIVSNATADVTGSVFASANAGGATSSIIGDRNRLVVTATKLVFIQQPVNTSLNGTMAAPAIAAVDIYNNRDLDFVANISITSTGTMTGTTITVAAVAGLSTFSSVVHTVIGTGYTLTATSGILPSTISSAFDITTVVFANGDYRSTGSGSWTSNTASPAIWQRFDGTTWNTSNSPSYTTSNNVYIRNGDVITTGGSFGSSVNLKIQSGGTFNSGHSSTAGSIYVYDGGRLNVNVILANNGTFDVENNGTVYINYAASGAATLWNGTENFRPASTFVINKWNPGATTPQILTSSNITTNTYSGYTAAFGNLTFDFNTNPGNDVDILEPGLTINLAHGNLSFIASPTVGGTARKINLATSGVITSGIGGDFMVDDLYTATDFIQIKTSGTMNFTIKGNMQLDAATVRVFTGTTASSSCTLNIDKDLNITPSAVLEFSPTVSVNPVVILNLKGDLTVAGSASLQNSNTSKKAEFNFVGTGDGLTPETTQTVDIATTGANENKNINFNVKNGAYLQLANRNFELGNNSGVIVESGGTFDFGFNGAIPLTTTISGSQTGTSFTSLQGSILKVTSPDGIALVPAVVGNVQTSTRTYEALGNFHYIGKVSQKIGNGLPVNIQNLVINNSGASGNNNVTLSNNAKIVHTTLSMVKGNVVTVADTIIILGASTAEKGTLSYTSGFVLGKMRRWFNGTNSGNASGLFPMGFNDAGLKNRHTKVEFTSVPTGGYLTVEFIGTPMGSAGLIIPAANTGGAGFDVETTEDQGYWKIDNGAGALADANYTITCTGEGFSIITDLSTITLLKRVGGGDWFCPGTHIPATGSPAMPILARSGVSGWSNFGFGGGVLNPLPVELLQFSAVCANGANTISWSTGSESNSSHFMVEKSTDGQHWRTVGSTMAAGNSSLEHDYSMTDLSQTNEVVYYKLKQFDMNGVFVTYNPVSLTCMPTDATLYEVYPNPNSGSFTVELNSYLMEGIVTIELMTSDGRLIETKQFPAKGGKEQVFFENHGLMAGVYLVKVKDQGDQLKTTKMIISK